MSDDIVARLVRWHTAMADEPKRAESKRTKHRETADLIERQAEELAALRKQLAERDAEIAALKGHAEAMAGEIRTAFWGGNPSTALARYRAAYTKED